MLTAEQYRFLKKVSKKNIQCNDLYKNRNSVYLYLLENKFIENHNVCPDNDIMEINSVLYCKITENGKVELSLCKQERYHFWIPTIISIIALVTSILAILTQNEELLILLKELLK